MSLTLYIGNKNYSSWSFRPWLAMKATNITFEEVFIPIYTDAKDKQRLLDVSPAGKVPILADGEVTVWDSIAIIEYLAEKFPQARLWPQDSALRAHARAISAEMHGGFGGLRRECGMNIHRPIRAKALSEEAKENIARVQEIWTDCCKRYGEAGPFLFGTFSAADAMYAPVVHRFRTYDIEVTPPVRAYMDTMLAHPAFAQWTAEALGETLMIERFEAD